MPTKKKDQYSGKRIILVILIVILIVFAIFLAMDIRNIYKSGTLKQRHSIVGILHKNKQADKISISDTDYIADWMTFHYINFIFDLPDNYLKDALNITDLRYPYSTLGRYAKEKKLDKNIFTQKVKTTVRSYQESH